MSGGIAQHVFPLVARLFKNWLNRKELFFTAFIHSRRVLIINGFISVEYIVTKNVYQNLTKGKNLVMNGFVKKNKVPVNKI